MEYESEALDQIRHRLEMLWKRIQEAPWAEKQELRLQYHVAYEVYRRQRMIAEYESTLRPSQPENELMSDLESHTRRKSLAKN